jgi:hypothetical protein
LATLLLYFGGKTVKLSQPQGLPPGHLISVCIGVTLTCVTFTCEGVCKWAIYSYSVANIEHASKVVLYTLGSDGDSKSVLYTIYV